MAKGQTIKKYIVVFVGIILTFPSFSQPFRYSEKIFFGIDTLQGVEYAKALWLNNPIDALTEYNIHDGERTTEERPLLMDVFTPRGDTLTKRPAIIFAHSGAFILGSRLNEDMVALCDSFARRGYVTATMDYRLGMGASVTRFFGVIVNISVSEESALRALYRGVQDGRAAVRFLKHNAGLYGVDTTKIYMVGSSAGGFMALHNVFLNRRGEVPAEAFEVTSLGGLDTVGIGGYGSAVNAAVSLWGALGDTDFIERESAPVFLVHGTADNIVPFKKGMPLEGIVPPNPILSFKMPETYGSFCVDTALNNRGIFHETYFVEGEGHEFYGVNTGEYPEGGPNQYWDTIIWKTSDFLLGCFRPSADFNTEANELAVSFMNFSSENYITEWDFGDGNFSSETNPVHVFPEAGDYVVSLKVYNRNLACDTISKIVTVSAPVQSAELVKDEITIYPNPVKERIYILGLEMPFDLAIYDLSGREKVINKEYKESFVDIGGLEPGIYILEVRKESTVTACKFCKVGY